MRKDPTEFRKRFATWKKGGKPYKDGKISDEQYVSIMENVAADNWQQWGDESEDAALTRILNDNAYDYRGYYNDNPGSAANADTHWPDKYKTVWHPTFSNQSKYSGKKSQYNPYGYPGGTWQGELFNPQWYQQHQGAGFYRDGYPKLPKFLMGTEGDKRKSTKGNRFADMSVEELEAQSKAVDQYWENKQRELSNRSPETIRQMGVDGDKEYRKRNPNGGQPNPKLQRANDLIVSSMKSQLPFTGEDYRSAANEQRQHSLDKWHDYKKGVEATAKAAELTFSAGTLVGAYANWKKWKDLANVGRATFSQLTKSKIANLLQKAQLPMQASGTVIDGAQTYNAVQNNDLSSAWWNGLSAAAGIGGTIGAADLFNNARLSYPMIDRIFDTSGIIQSAADVLKFGIDNVTNTRNEPRNK